MQILFRQVAVKILESVNHRWVALKRHMTLQSIIKYRRNDWPLGFNARFFLDNRCEGDNFVRR